jgi:dephospho-CoA kinase
MSDNKIVVGLAGMPGSGKSLVVETANELGYAIVVMGDVVREETKKLGLELTPQNVGKVMLQLRAEGGVTVVAQKCIPKIEGQKSSKILIDGLRSLYEVDAFKAHFAKFSIAAVHAAPEARFIRLTTRCRSDDPSAWDVFRERDVRELSVGLGNVIAMAEQMIINDSSVEDTKVKVAEALRRIEEKWLK